MFKMKLLAGVAAVALSSAANAGIVGSAGGNTELVFTAYVGNVGYTYDLSDLGFNDVFGSNVLMNSLIGSGNQTNYNSASAATNGAQLIQNKAYLASNFSTGIVFDAALPSFSDFLTTAGGSSGVLWNVWSGESAGVKRIIQTVVAAPTERPQSSAIVTAVSAFENYTDANSQGGTHDQGDVTIDGFRITNDKDLTAFAGNVAPSLNGVFASFGSLDDTLAMYVIRSANPNENTFRGGVAQLLGGTDLPVTAKVVMGGQGEYRLQIAVVPEPETYAMLLAGLGLIGFVARRRSA